MGTKKLADCKKILIAGVGNVLRQDDGFGVEVVQRLLERETLPEGVKVLDTGIAGIRLVQELMDGYDVLLIIDAMERTGQPGQLYLLEADVPGLDHLSFDERNQFLADMHYTNPTRAMMLARAMNVLPPRVYILGCQPAAYDDFDLGLSAEVQAAVPAALAQIDDWLASLKQQNNC